MKKYIYLLILSLVLFLPSQIKAIETDNYYYVNGIQNFELDKIEFNDLVFNDYTNTSSQSFGLTGYIINNNPYDVDITLKTTYYNEFYEKKVETSKEISLKAKEKAYLNNMFNKGIIIDGETAEDTKYYKIDIEINDIAYSDEVFKKPSEIDNYKNYDFVIDAYDIDIIVNENNSFDITEKITAFFNISKHGIYRTIPLQNEITRLDGTTAKNRAKISNVYVNDNYDTSKNSDEYEIKIGSASSYVEGKQEYTIKYTYSLSNDNNKEYDELYFNIIGDEWITVMGNITFSITMPKEFDQSKLGFSSGAYGSVDNSNVYYQVNDNVITGGYNGYLQANEALTIRVELPEGYFKTNLDNTIFIYIIPFICLLISILIWFKFGKDDKPIETVEFYPPEDFNSLEVGFLYKGSVEDMDCISLLIYLANKGYIKIQESEEDSLFSKSKGFKIIKVKDYDGNDLNERLFLEGLFENRATETTDTKLKYKFYLTINEIIRNINSKENKKRIFEKNTKKTILVVLCIVISLLVIITIPSLEYQGIGSIFLTLFLSLFYTPFFATLFSKGMPKGLKIFLTIFLLFHSAVFFSATPLVEAMFTEKRFLFSILFGILCIIGMCACCANMKKRTKYGTEILGKIKGFKNFLETAEKERLESLVFQNPEYFYNILPYTYVLGVSDKWIEKFETIAIEAPSWYGSETQFNHVTFNTFINDTMNKVETNVGYTRTSSSSSSGGGFSSGGGGSSGGGSSGGGSGGGGGGSW